MGNGNSSLKLICINPECINKSVVWRKFTTDPNCFSCKKCGQALERVKNAKSIKQDQVAKRQLEGFGE